MAAAEPGVYQVTDQHKDAVKREEIRRMEQANLAGLQLRDFTHDANLYREAEYFLHVYNIADRVHKIQHPMMARDVPACPPGQPWVEVFKIPSIVQEKKLDENDHLQINGIFGERLATDILNAQNHGIDPFAETDSFLDEQGSTDLTRRGMFWSRNNPPTEEELRKCREKMEKHYRRMLLQADMLAAENRIKEINDDHRAAAKYFKISSKWYVVATRESYCKNCGEPIREGIAFHTTPSGQLCILDWKRAVEAGAKTKAEVPEGHRWWTDKEK